MGRGRIQVIILHFISGRTAKISKIARKRRAVKKGKFLKFRLFYKEEQQQNSGGNVEERKNLRSTVCRHYINERSKCEYQRQGRP